MKRDVPHSVPAIRPRTRRNGFTLLEIIVSLAIVSVLATMFAVKFMGEATGEELRAPAHALKKMALTANRQASAFRDEYRITFFPDAFFLSRAPIIERHNAIERSFKNFVISEGEAINLEIRRLGNPKWIRPDATEWLFQPAGLCEPIEVRFSGRDGFIEMTFNPMTGGVDDEQFLFR